MSRRPPTVIPGSEPDFQGSVGWYLLRRCWDSWTCILPENLCWMYDDLRGRFEEVDATHQIQRLRTSI
ncbi:hypothetical protein CMUS01_10555 [Colletotrichum musicola]|uniref:Uncharacterized protein n=1 Tax=Colletotrichum musicola TaxID=2175873 RepID=A0A8H6K3H6_9PEZI|nr:hypothetical protein CMUS01_10555 [Colletotrichum musicola]